MDYRHTEDFARAMEAAELRAHRLREQDLDSLFAAIGRGLQALWRRVVRLVRRERSERLLPEA